MLEWKKMHVEGKWRAVKGKKLGLFWVVSIAKT